MILFPNTIIFRCMRVVLHSTIQYICRYVCMYINLNVDLNFNFNYNFNFIFIGIWIWWDQSLQKFIFPFLYYLCYFLFWLFLSYLFIVLFVIAIFLFIFYSIRIQYVLYAFVMLELILLISLFNDGYRICLSFLSALFMLIFQLSNSCLSKCLTLQLLKCGL